MSISMLEGLFGREKSTITIMNFTSRCSSRCPSRCAIHYGYRAWTFPKQKLVGEILLFFLQGNLAGYLTGIQQNFFKPTK